MLQLREYQERGLEALRDGVKQGHRSQILYGPTGSGKCLGKDTPVLMADGTIKLSQSIEVGDYLMGPDGKPRMVRGTTCGEELLYKITPTKGDPYIVNSSHILSLRKTPCDDRITLSDGTIVDSSMDIVNVNVEVIFNSNNTAKHCLKGWRSGVIEKFYRDEEEHLIPPYILGAWLGDGSIGQAIISKPYCNMVKEWIKYGESLGYGCKEERYSQYKCPSWRLTKGNDGSHFNLIQNALSIIGVAKEKHIPDSYKFANSSIRKEILAGLIDSDGHINKSGCDWITKDKRLADDFVFLCRSLGLSCYLSYQNKKIKKQGFSGWYWRASVSGDLHSIPMRDKKASIRLQKKRHLVHGISIEPIGIGEYYGFSIDGDNLFLLGDLTVTHNTESAISLLLAALNKGNKSGMILDRRILCDQTSLRLDKYSIDHGVLMSGHWRYRPHEKIQICSAQTLEKIESMPDWSLAVIDEAHTIRKQTADFIKNTGILSVGLSASPFTKGLGQIYSNVISVVTTNELVKSKNLVPLRVFIAKEIDMTGANKVAGEWSQKETTERGIKITGDIVAEWINKTHLIFGKPEKTIVFCSGVAHGADLARKFSECGYNFVSISYKDDDEFKRQAIEEFSKPDSSIVGLIATDVLTKGFDVPSVKIGVSARPFSKSFSSHVRQMGRVMRSCHDKEFAVWLDHSGNYLRFEEDWDDLYHNGVNELDDGREKPKKEPTDKEKEASKCPKCSHLWPRNSDTCLCCGFVRERKNDVVAVPGEMVELQSKNEKYPQEYKQKFYSELIGYAANKNFKEGWAYFKFKEKFGVFPATSLKKIKSEPSKEVLNFVKYLAIKSANRK